MLRDTSEVKKPEAMEAGWRRGRVESCEIVESGPNSTKPGSPQFKIQVSITEGDDQGKYVKPAYLPLDMANGQAHRTKAFVGAVGKLNDDGTFDDEEVANHVTGLDLWFKLDRRKQKDAAQAEQFGEFENNIIAWSLEDPEQAEQGQEASEAAESDAAPKRAVQKPAAAKPNGVKHGAGKPQGAKGREARR